jgi:undecaprenyl pyrophosphate synthase
LLDRSGYILIESIKYRNHRNYLDAVKNFKKAVKKAKLTVETITREEIEIHVRNGK